MKKLTNEEVNKMYEDYRNGKRITLNIVNGFEVSEETYRMYWKLKAIKEAKEMLEIEEREEYKGKAESTIMEFGD